MYEIRRSCNGIGPLLGDRPDLATRTSTLIQLQAKVVGELIMWHTQVRNESVETLRTVFQGL